MIISDYRWNPILYGPSTLRHHGRLYAPSCVPALLLPVGSLAQVRYNLVTRTAVLPILPGGPLLVLVPDGDLLDTSNQRTFLGEATVQGRCPKPHRQTRSLCMHKNRTIRPPPWPIGARPYSLSYARVNFGLTEF